MSATTHPGDIELLVRGIFRHRGRVLLVRRVGTEYTFLPGGHIEPGEPAREALRRELLEETGCRVDPGPFWGAVEHRFRQGNQEIHEVNLVFLVEPPPGLLRPQVVSREAHLEFSWYDVNSLTEANLQPTPLCTAIRCWETSLSPAGAGWASTMAGPEGNG